MFTQSIGPTKLCTQSGASTLGPPLTRSPNQIGQQKSFGATPQSPNNHKCQSQAKVCIVFDFQQHKWPEQASWLAPSSLAKGRGQRGGSYGWHICRRIINWNKLIFAEYWTSSSTRRRTNTQHRPKADNVKAVCQRLCHAHKPYRRAGSCKGCSLC